MRRFASISKGRRPKSIRSQRRTWNCQYVLYTMVYESLSRVDKKEWEKYVVCVLYSTLLMPKKERPVKPTPTRAPQDEIQGQQWMLLALPCLVVPQHLENPGAHVLWVFLQPKTTSICAGGTFFHYHCLRRQGQRGLLLCPKHDNHGAHMLRVFTTHHHQHKCAFSIAIAFPYAQDGTSGRQPVRIGRTKSQTTVSFSFLRLVSSTASRIDVSVAPLYELK